MRPRGLFLVAPIACLRQLRKCVRTWMRWGIHWDLVTGEVTGANRVAGARTGEQHVAPARALITSLGAAKRDHVSLQGEPVMRRWIASLVVFSAIAICGPTLADTIAHWRFEEGTDGNGTPGAMPGTFGHVRSDYNSPALNGTLAVGEPVYVTEVPGQVIDGAANRLALWFNGSDAFYVLANSLLDFGPAGIFGDFTIECFIKVESVPNNGRSYRIVQKRGTVDGVYHVGYDTWIYTGADSTTYLGRAVVLIKDNTAGGATTSIRVDDSQWHHLAFQRTADNRLRVWVDYILRANAASLQAGSLVNPYDLWVGCGRTIGNEHYFVGFIDEIRISDAALEPDQMLHAAACVVPTITQQPQGQAVSVGSLATFAVSASGTGPLTYQWRKGGQPLTDGGRISGATTATLTVSPSWLADAGSYDVVIGGVCGSVTSEAATLTVTAMKGDMNCDGVISFADINPFVLAISGYPAYVAQYPNCEYLNADCNQDGYVSFADINPFVRLLAGG